MNHSGPIPNAKVDDFSDDEPEAAQEDHQEAPNASACPVAVSLMSLARPPENDPGELLKNRFLCRGGGLLLVGPTGVGKSSLSMQIMIGLSLGENVLGLEPARPLTSLLIQAENDEGDLAEFRDGTVAGMNLTESEKATVGDRVIICTEDTRSGFEFCTAVVEPLLEKFRPDLLWIDPALAYIGGDSNSGKDVGGFLRQGLNPLIHRYGCAVVIIHHTAKPLRVTEGAKAGSQDFAYAGSGSAEWANWSRATLALDPVADGVFRLIARKRGSRLRWKDEAGESTVRRCIRHCREEGRVWWEEATEEEAGTAPVGGKAQKIVADLMDLVPLSRSISKTSLQEAAQVAGINEKRFRQLSALALEKHDLYEWSVKRANARPAVHLARFPQPAEGWPEENEPEEAA